MLLLYEVKLQKKLFLSSRRLTLHSEWNQPVYKRRKRKKKGTDISGNSVFFSFPPVYISEIPLPIT